MSRHTDITEKADHELIALSKQGDRDAFGELWRRHSDAARRVAYVYAPALAEDITVDAFAAVFQQFQKQGGPDHSFRAYLYTVVRNLAARSHRERAHFSDQPLDDDMAAPMTVEDETIAQLESGATATAFRALPERWQSVLWYLDVEGLKPQQAAPLLGLEPNAVSALAVRAREALKQNWIDAQIAGTGGTPECSVVDENLGKFTRKRVSARTQKKIDEHAAGCARCRAVIGEGAEVDRRLAAVLFPIVTGLTGAALLRDQFTAGAAVAAPVPVQIFEPPVHAVDAGVLEGVGFAGAGAGAGGGAGSGGGSGPGAESGGGVGTGPSSTSGISTALIVGIAATVLVAAAGIGTAIVVNGGDGAPAATSPPLVAPESEKQQPDPGSQTPPSAEPVGESTDAPEAPRTEEGTRTPPTRTPARPTPQPSPSTAPDAEAERPAVPILGAVASVAGGSLPTGISGTGRVGATVVVTRGSETIGSTTVGADGTWSVPFEGVVLAPGTTVFTARQSIVSPTFGELASAPLEVSVVATAPTLTVGAWSVQVDGYWAPITVDLAPGATVQLFHRSSEGVITDLGLWQEADLAGMGWDTNAAAGSSVEIGAALVDPATPGLVGPTTWVYSVISII